MGTAALHAGSGKRVMVIVIIVSVGFERSAGADVDFRHCCRLVRHLLSPGRVRLLRPERQD